METLDNILSGKGETAPEPEKEQAQAAVTQTEDGTQIVSSEEITRVDDSGSSDDKGKTVPIDALHAERQRAKRYTEQVADFERRLKESDAAWERRLNQMVAALGQKPKEPMPAADWFQDPDVAFRQRGEELLNPVISQMQTLQSELAQMRAERVFGDKYQDFIAHVTEAARSGDPEIRVLSAMMDASPRPYEVAKEWFERRTFDPAAKEAEIEARILEKYGIKPNANPEPKPVQQQAMPTALEAARNVGSRSGPAWAGPKPLEDIFKR